MTKGDQLVERGAEKLERLSERAAADGSGLKGRLAGELAEDAAFLRKLKPSLMVARAKGEAPTDEKPGEPRRTPGRPQLGTRPKPSKRDGDGPSPWAIVAAALAAGVLLAKMIDWRGHAHPRD